MKPLLTQSNHNFLGLVEPRARGVIGREGEVLPPENIVPFPEDEEVVIIPKTTYPAETLTTPDPTQTLLPRVASIANGRNYIDGKRKKTSSITISERLSN